MLAPSFLIKLFDKYNLPLPVCEVAEKSLSLSTSTVVLGCCRTISADNTGEAITSVH